jgi:hypothetical protein
MKGRVEVRICFEHGHEHGPACVIPFESEAFRDALVPVDHFDETAHPITRMFCTTSEVKRVRTVARERFVSECTRYFAECLRKHLDGNDTLMGYAIEPNNGVTDADVGGVP